MDDSSRHSSSDSSDDSLDYDSSSNDEHDRVTDLITINTSIPETNVGYRLLEKLGWKPGSGLGTQCQGRVDPVPISAKADMLGLGKAEEYASMIVESTSKRCALTSEVISKETDTERAKREADASAKAAIREQVSTMTQAFTCELCDKRYSNVAEWERHLSSYSHNHKKRFKEMREQTKLLQSARIGLNGDSEKGEVPLDKRERERLRREEAEAKELRRMLKLAGKTSSAQSKNASPVPTPGIAADKDSDVSTPEVRVQGTAGWKSAEQVTPDDSGEPSGFVSSHTNNPSMFQKVSFGLPSAGSNKKSLQPRKFKLVFGKK